MIRNPPEDYTEPQPVTWTTIADANQISAKWQPLALSLNTELDEHALKSQSPNWKEGITDWIKNISKLGIGE